MIQRHHLLDTLNRSLVEEFKKKQPQPQSKPVPKEPTEPPKPKQPEVSPIEKAIGEVLTANPKLVSDFTMESGKVAIAIRQFGDPASVQFAIQRLMLQLERLGGNLESTNQLYGANITVRIKNPDGGIGETD